MDIVNGHKNKYKLMSRKFEFDDLRLLAQCVYAAKFISKNQAETIIDTLGEFCSVYQAEDLKADVLLEDRVKIQTKGNNADYKQYQRCYGKEAKQQAAHTAENQF